MGAVDAGKPVVLMYGEVTGVSPLKVNVEQKLTLEGPQLILTHTVTDYEAMLSPVQDESAPQRYKMHNKLVIGDIVLLLRVQGGLKFVVVDRVTV